MLIEHEQDPGLDGSCCANGGAAARLRPKDPLDKGDKPYVPRPPWQYTTATSLVSLWAVIEATILLSKPSHDLATFYTHADAVGVARATFAAAVTATAWICWFTTWIVLRMARQHRIVLQEARQQSDAQILRRIQTILNDHQTATTDMAQEQAARDEQREESVRALTGVMRTLVETIVADGNQRAAEAVRRAEDQLGRLKVVRGDADDRTGA